MKKSGKNIPQKEIVTATKTVYRFRPIVLQVIGVTLMVVGALLIAIPVMRSGDTEINNNVKLDFTEISESVDSDEMQENIEESENKIADGISTVRVSAATFTAGEKSAFNIQRIQSTGVWTATDYVPGDIGVGAYEVQLGDTLWEISEAVYGDGFQWTRILEDNSGSIGFLSDGSQALIVPGQVLVIGK